MENHCDGCPAYQKHVNGIRCVQIEGRLDSSSSVCIPYSLYLLRSYSIHCVLLLLSSALAVVVCSNLLFCVIWFGLVIRNKRKRDTPYVRLHVCVVSGYMVVCASSLSERIREKPRPLPAAMATEPAKKNICLSLQINLIFDARSLVAYTIHLQVYYINMLATYVSSL